MKNELRSKVKLGGTQRSKYQWLAAVTVGLIGVIGGSAVAQATSDYPKSPIKMVIPYPPGGPTDLVGRLAAASMADLLKQVIVIDNRAGASGMVGAAQVAKAAPDGYTLLANASLHVINPAVYDKIPYDSFNDFVPITQLVDVPLVLVVNSELPVSNVQELIAYLKKSSTAVNFGSAGNASAQHLSGELFKLKTNIPMQHVPYKGSSPALADLMGGQLQFMFDSMPSAMPFISSGRLKPLAVTTSQRATSLPNVPTMQEAGVPEFETSTWYGLWAPKNTPPAIVEKLADAARDALKKPEVAAQYNKMGAEPVGSTPAQFQAYMRSEEKKWADIVKRSGARVD